MSTNTTCIHKCFFSCLGRWYYFSQHANISQIQRQDRKKLHDDPSDLRLTSQFCFKPFDLQFGSTEASLRGGIYDTKLNSFFMSTDFAINATVMNRNDPPVIAKTTLTLPEPIPYNYTRDHSINSGFTVEQILGGQVSDPDFNDPANKIGNCINLFLRLTVLLTLLQEVDAM